MGDHADDMYTTPDEQARIEAVHAKLKAGQVKPTVAVGSYYLHIEAGRRKKVTA